MTMCVSLLYNAYILIIYKLNKVNHLILQSALPGQYYTRKKKRIISCPVLTVCETNMSIMKQLITVCC